MMVKLRSVFWYLLRRQTDKLYGVHSQCKPAGHRIFFAGARVRVQPGCGWQTNAQGTILNPPSGHGEIYRLVTGPFGPEPTYFVEFDDEQEEIGAGEPGVAYIAAEIEARFLREDRWLAGRKEHLVAAHPDEIIVTTVHDRWHAQAKPK